MSKHTYSKISVSLIIDNLKPRNLVAKDLRTSKYRMRTVERKDLYKRKEKYVKPVDFCS